MIFQHTLGALLRGEKTETSRLIKPGDELFAGDFDPDSVMRRGYSSYRTIYEVGKDYAIQPGRTVKSVGRFKVLGIWRQDVRTLTPEQVAAEGFAVKNDMGSEGYYYFMKTWIAMHDHNFDFRFDASIVDYRVRVGRVNDIVAWDTLKQMINSRPAEKYMAWRMSIKVLWDTVDWTAPAVVALGIKAHA